VSSTNAVTFGSHHWILSQVTSFSWEWRVFFSSSVHLPCESTNAWNVHGALGTPTRRKPILTEPVPELWLNRRKLLLPQESHFHYSRHKLLIHPVA